MAECVRRLEERFDTRFGDDFVPRFRARMEDAFRDRLRPVDGALDLVRSMAGPIGVASNGPRSKMELTLSLTGLLPCFGDRVFSAYEVGSWKPDPGLFLHAARALGVPPGRWHEPQLTARYDWARAPSVAVSSSGWMSIARLSCEPMSVSNRPHWFQVSSGLGGDSGPVVGRLSCAVLRPSTDPAAGL